MVVYDRREPDEIHAIDRWANGVGWLAHPTEIGRRASHAVLYDGDVWVFDPLDGPGVDELLAELGEVAGVAVFSNYHARDAGAVAARHDVPVSVPSWLHRARRRFERRHPAVPIEVCAETLGDSGFELRRYEPIPGYKEAFAYHDAEGTLYVPDALGTAPLYTVGDERVGVYPSLRVLPPRRVLGDLAPRRILVGHGTGVFEDAPRAIRTAVDGSRRRAPSLYLRNLRSVLPF